MVLKGAKIIPAVTQPPAVPRAVAASARGRGPRGRAAGSEPTNGGQGQAARQGAAPATGSGSGEAGQRQQEELAMARSSHSVSPTRAVVLGLALLFASLPASRLAAQLLNAPNDNLPLQVQADSGIEWQQNNQLYIARGNAVATRGPSEVHATP